MSSDDSKCKCTNCHSTNHVRVEEPTVNQVTYTQDPCGVLVTSDAYGTTYTVKPLLSNTAGACDCFDYTTYDANGNKVTYVPGGEYAPNTAHDPYAPKCFVESGFQMSFTDHQIMEIERRVARLEGQTNKPMSYEEMDDVDELVMDLEMLIRDNPDYYYIVEALVNAALSEDE